ncbi:retinaldehyde-binding protein 1 isoform X2 [Stomoxys calcitrans]|uniref:retinaldehyde-binding protein 1 isoform X2 n=1 Tax=Stomoxys calcitrans TaxID=35570 RepID=UPI0027E34BDB|nr:retinaldehyde-binding protein 1 isoform X2 [Stomoxys calcitrans]
MMANIKSLPAELQKIAIEELNEVPSRIPQDLETLRTWIKQQPHLRARTDDQFLIQFLRGCKYSLEKAKEKIDLFFTLRTKYPDMFGFTDVDDPKFKQYFNLGCYTFLPKPLNGCRIVLVQFNYSSEKHSLEDIFYAGAPLFELAMLHDPYTTVRGLHFMFDMGKSNLKHFLQITPMFCKKLVLFLEKSMPFRIQSVFFINAPSFAQQFFKIVIPLYSAKLQKRTQIIGNDINELTKHIPLEFLPRHLGGDNGDYSEITEQQFNKFQLHREYFKENAQYGTDESLRPGKTMDLEGLFGVGGSFRKLSVD